MDCAVMDSLVALQYLLVIRIEVVNVMVRTAWLAVCWQRKSNLDVVLVSG